VTLVRSGAYTGAMKVWLLLAGLACLTAAPAVQNDPPWRREIAGSCLDCHGGEKPKGGFNLEPILKDDPARHASAWEKVVRRLRTRQMPPAGKSRPGEEAYSAMISGLEAALDGVKPDPGTTDTIRRLTRLEYQNAIRDLLALEIDAAALLPPDESSHGFDSATTGTLSPTLLERTLSAAQKISRLAVGGIGRSPGGDTFRVPPDVTQEERVDGLPPGTRGGLRIPYTFPQDGDYDVRVRLMRDRDELVEGLHDAHELLVLLDRRTVKKFTVTAPRRPQDHAVADANLTARLPFTAGPHDLGITFLKKPSSVVETLRQPYDAHFNTHRHPRLGPAIFEVSITGPYGARGPGDSPSRKRLLRVMPKSPAEEIDCAKANLAPLLRRAYRRPVTEADLERILTFFRKAREGSDFETGMEAALSAVLVSHDFLFRVERPPAATAPGAVYAISDLDLASRLSFFLWCSIPDEELLDRAERGELGKPDVLAAQARRMLADPRARTLATSFAAQWLHLRNLDDASPDRRLFPDFDDNLRQAMRRETELLFEEILRDDRSVLDLLRSDHAYLNERLAKHYGIPHVYGTHFRRVALDPESRRGGLLRHASVLTVTSYATRTSPVLRGKWVLENLIGTPPPPPLPDVPALDDNTVSASLPGRERLAKHRAQPACAVCHDRIDPVGFALENFDAVGRWRTLDAERPVDASGVLPDGSAVEGIAGLEAALVRRPEDFTTALSEKLLTYALGRGVTQIDGPAVRAIVREARQNQDRLSAIVVGVVKSVPFRMRKMP
jgi:mono/diheme cytochrome c family protein